jgi:hypothetical protein
MLCLMKQLNLKVPDFIYKFNFKVSFNSKRQAEIKESSVNLSELLISLNELDSKSQEEIILKLEFNFLRPFSAEINVMPKCKVDVELNTFKNSIIYRLY